MTAACLISLAVLAPAAMAAAPDIQSSVTVTGPSIQQKVHINQQEFNAIKGTYVLENGKTLTVSQNQNRYYVEIAGSEKQEIIPTSSTKFVSAKAGDKLNMNFELKDFSTNVYASFNQAAQ